MATSHAEITPGSGTKVATHEISEDGSTKHLQRFVATDSAGVTLIGEKPATASGSVTLSAENVVALNAMVVALGDIITALAPTTAPIPIQSGIYHVEVTPVISTSIYASGEVLFDRIVITNATKVAGAGADLMTIEIIDKDAEGAAMSLYFLETDVAFGTLNDAVSISDANAVKLFGPVHVLTTDYTTVSGVKKAVIKGVNLLLTPASGSRNLYVAAVVGGTPTYTNATDLVFKFGFVG